MPAVVWDEKYTTGDRVVDDQHQTLFELINELHALAVVGGANHAMGRAVRGLTRCLSGYFAYEERLMESTQYPRLREHQERHLTIRAQAGELLRQHLAGSPMRGGALSHFLGQKLSAHIVEMDRPMVEFARRQWRMGEESGRTSFPAPFFVAELIVPVPGAGHPKALR